MRGHHRGEGSEYSYIAHDYCNNQFVCTDDDFCHFIFIFAQRIYVGYYSQVKGPFIIPTAAAFGGAIRGYHLTRSR